MSSRNARGPDRPAGGEDLAGRATAAVCIVTHHDGEDLPDCFASVSALSIRPLMVAVADCGSGDDSVERARAFRDAAPDGVTVRVVPLDENRGFAGGMNAAIAATRSEEGEGPPWILTLNPDARPAPDSVDRLLAAAEAGEARTGRPVGAVTGRLVRMETEGAGAAEPSRPGRLDACGMYLTPAWRHHDRGSGEVDRGQYDRPERVFGATGAASLFRREALEDVAFEPEPADGAEPELEIFDARFHTFREDAELAFRLRERGWEVLYEPSARCEHRRFNLPTRRSAMPAMVNYHSLKNRYLLRAGHQTPGNALRTAPWALGRDLAALLYVLLRERSSLPAYRWLWRHRDEILERRRWLQSRRTVPPAAIDRWFRVRGIPIPEE